MLTKDDRRYAKKRKRIWDIFGWYYSGIAYLSKNHSLNCGCGMCIAKTKMRRLENKQNRMKAKLELKNEVDKP
jgi:hypothetical protein